MTVSGSDAGAFFQQVHTLVYTEAVLFVDDNQPKATELNPLLHQGMGSDDKLCTSADSLQCFCPFFAGDLSAQPHGFDPQWLKPRAENPVVLFRK